MLLGKRPRPPVMKRTTSMTEFTLDPTVGEAPVDHHQSPPNSFKAAAAAAGGGAGGLDQRFLASAAISPRNHRRDSGDLIDTAHFLRSCSLCKRRLVPGRDIYMYKGDSAFCSLECREQQMNQDDIKERSGR
ncbi:hypothetical protein U1Q18_017576 [Sarracenia purpurea var. burkii]